MKPEKQLYQWDVNQYLTGINPAAQYVDYTIDNEVIRLETDGTRCRIPDEVLQTYGGKTCYERYPDGTYRAYSFTVLYAPKPPEYVYTPEERTTFEALTARVDAAIDEIKRRADSGEFTPVKGVDYFTDAEKTELMEGVSSGAVGEFRKVVDTATTEYNVNHTEKMTAYDTNAEQHTSDYNRNAAEKQEAYNQNHTEKVAEYNANAETKTAEFDSNAAEKLKAYNDNADNKVAEFDSHTEQIQTDINGLKSDLSKWIILDGVTIKDGTDLSPLIIESGEHGYYSNNGVITPITYNDFKYFKLPIDGGNTYYLDNAFRWAFTTDADGNVVDSDNVGSDRITTSDNAVMLWVTYNKVNLPESRKIAKGSSPTDTIFEIPSNVVLVNADTDNISNGIVSKTGTFSASGDNILLSSARSNLRKGIRLVFEATVTSGTDFEIGFSVSESSANTYPHNIISVTADNIAYNNVNYPHGLSIADRVQMIFEYLSNGSADITLISNGNMFKQNVSFTMSNPAVPYVKSNGLIATDCKFTFICTDIRKKIWMFGDSYFAYSTARWTYYLKEYGYDTNVLLDGFPGMGSVNARTSFAKLLTLGKPSYAIWFMGMNDGTDTDDTTPNAKWVTERDNFIALCETNGIEPIFATIPNVPSINHKGKNKWIRESGYRYIDMCHAVGADVNVNWYGDMLSSDKVHPSESGAKALFAQVLLDLPEVMVDNL